MELRRRAFLSACGISLINPLLLPAAQGQFPRVHRVPDGRNPSAAPDDLPAIPPRDPKVQLKENQKNLRRDADHLLELAQELKDEADKTEQTEVLSLPLVRKAEEVEKLARKVKDLARAI